MRVARTAFTRYRSSGKRNRVRERWEQRGFSPADLLNLWEPIGAWEQHRGLAYGGKPRQKLDVYKPRYAAKAPVLVFSMAAAGKSARAISTPLSALRWRRKASSRSCRIIRFSRWRTQRERCALPARAPRNGAAIPRGWC